MKPIYSPLRIEILIRFYLRACQPLGESDLVHPDSPAAREEIRNLGAEGAIMPVRHEGVCGYCTTPLGRAWIKAICNVPPPRQVWMDEMNRIL